MKAVPGKGFAETVPADWNVTLRLVKSSFDGRMKCQPHQVSWPAGGVGQVPWLKVEFWAPTWAGLRLASAALAVVAASAMTKAAAMIAAAVELPTNNRRCGFMLSPYHCTLPTKTFTVANSRLSCLSHAAVRITQTRNRRVKSRV
jgi:hypothetical protein